MSPIEKMKLEDLEIGALKGVSLDSRGVKRGYLFAALAGSQQDGARFISDALINGASHILMRPNTTLPDIKGLVRVIENENPRKAFSGIVARFYQKQPETIVAVTGTNGKTSTVHFINQLWKMLGVKAAGLGTLGLSVGGNAYHGCGGATTPDPVSLHAELADLAAAGVDHLAMEASSHGLDQYRLDHVRVKVAAFTNFTHDHLDYHQDMQSYFEAKKRLFTDVLIDGGVCVLNADAPEYAALKGACTARGHKVYAYGAGDDADFKICAVSILPQGQKIALEVLGKSYDVTLPLAGAFQSMNALCALACVVAQEPENVQRTEFLVHALEKLRGVPGRLQLVQGRGDYAVYVDYAHTPDALETVLRALRVHTRGRLICLFGCGGNRDHAKRPVMGRIAALHADVVIVTDDNPRNETPADIRAHIIKNGAQHAKCLHEIADRRAAIGFAISDIQAGDVLLVAGKGHEQGQVFNGYAEPFDDVSEVEIAMRRVK